MRYCISFMLLLLLLLPGLAIQFSTGDEIK